MGENREQARPEIKSKDALDLSVLAKAIGPIDC